MQDNQEELFPIVDENGQVIGQVTRGEAHSGKGILHPVVHLHVFNSKGELYLQKRPAWKSIQPNRWDTACGGHIAYGERVEEALRREVMEELGMSDYTPKYITHYIFETAVDREYVNIFTTIYDGEVKPSDELDGGRFFTRQEIEEKMGTDFFTPNFESEYVTYVLPNMPTAYELYSHQQAAQFEEAIGDRCIGDMAEGQFVRGH